VEYWLVFLLLHMALMAYVNCIVVLMDDNNVGLVIVGSLVMMWAFGGLIQNYKSIAKTLGNVGLFLNMISPFKWSMELQIIVEMDTYASPAWPTKSVYDFYTFDRQV